MPRVEFKVQNVKCQGCATTIRNGLGTLPGVDAVEVVVETGMVAVDGENIPQAEIQRKLAELGYPVAAS